MHVANGSISSFGAVVFGQTPANVLWRSLSFFLLGWTPKNVGLATMGVLFSLFWLAVAGTGLGWFYSIDQGNPSNFPERTPLAAVFSFSCEPGGLRPGLCVCGPARAHERRQGAWLVARLGVVGAAFEGKTGEYVTNKRRRVWLVFLV